MKIPLFLNATAAAFMAGGCAADPVAGKEKGRLASEGREAGARSPTPERLRAPGSSPCAAPWQKFSPPQRHPQKRLDDLAILNGRPRNERVNAGSLIKLVEK